MCTILMYLKEVNEMWVVQSPHASNLLREKVSSTVTQAGLVNHLHSNNLCKQQQKHWVDKVGWWGPSGTWGSSSCTKEERSSRLKIGTCTSIEQESCMCITSPLSGPGAGEKGKGMATKTTVELPHLTTLFRTSRQL